MRRSIACSTAARRFAPLILKPARHSSCSAARRPSAANSRRASQVSLDAGVRGAGVAAGARHLDAESKRFSSSRRHRRPALRAAAWPSRSSTRASRRIRIFRSAAFALTRTSSVAAALPIDSCGHGTHVAGIVAGSGAHSNGAYAGIAPDVDIVALRVLGDDCSGNTSDVIDALEWIARNHERYNIKVVNLSLGHAVLESIFTDPLVQAVERLSRKGIAVVTAAGNKGINPATGDPGYGGVGVPCNAPSAICVGSLDTQGTSEPLRRSRVGLELARPDALRSARQARPGRARREHRFARRTRQPPVQRIRGSARARLDRPARILHAVGHEHGLARGGGRGGAAASRESTRSRSTRSRLSLQFTARLVRRPTC